MAVAIMIALLLTVSKNLTQTPNQSGISSNSAIISNNNTTIPQPTTKKIPFNWENFNNFSLNQQRFSEKQLQQLSSSLEVQNWLLHWQLTLNKITVQQQTRESTQTTQQPLIMHWEDGFSNINVRLIKYPNYWVVKQPSTNQSIQISHLEYQQLLPDWLGLAMVFKN